MAPEKYRWIVAKFFVFSLHNSFNAMRTEPRFQHRMIDDANGQHWLIETMIIKFREFLLIYSRCIQLFIHKLMLCVRFHQIEFKWAIFLD